jgi:precorrin-6B methylase 2
MILSPSLVTGLIKLFSGRSRVNFHRRAFPLLVALCLASISGAGSLAEDSAKPFEPYEGQAGKDVVWVPTPQSLVEKMLDMAAVTPQDFVMDLGSGDGRNIIAAAKRGARTLGVEYNPDMVALSRRNAAKEGVADKAIFVQGDMFEADISQATVLALFLLTDNLNKLAPKFLDLNPGTRIVLNTFVVDNWEVDATEKVEKDCSNWCTAHLYIVPAKVAGTWHLPEGQLNLEQKFQKIAGTLSSGSATTPIENGRLRGDLISFSVGGRQYSGRVNGNQITGDVKGSPAGTWTATRM